jgi:hypothetical protein
MSGNATNQALGHLSRSLTASLRQLNPVRAAWFLRRTIHEKSERIVCNIARDILVVEPAPRRN